MGMRRSAWLGAAVMAAVVVGIAATAQAVEKKQVVGSWTASPEEGTVVGLVLGDDGRMVMTTTRKDDVQTTKGTWTLEKDVLTLSLANDKGEKRDVKLAVKFEGEKMVLTAEGDKPVTFTKKGATSAPTTPKGA